MAFTSGRFVICAHPDCDSVSLTTVSESFDEQDRIWVGQQLCDVCGCSMWYSRRAETPEENQMVKKATKRKFSTKTPKKSPKRTAAVTLKGPKGEVLFEGSDAAFKKAARSGHRVTTHKPNGGMGESQEVAPAPVPIGEAMRLAVQQLGDVVIDADAAPGQLRQLADCYERVTEEQAAYNTKADAARIAKKSLESATALLLEKVRAFTHPAPLPLFDQTERDEDLKAMVDGSEQAEA